MEIDIKTHVRETRAYQLEMFEASLKDNVIVVMDTGSGKTHVAILRIMHHLEHSQNQKLIWFLAPTVTLCKQQYRVLRQSLPSTSIVLMTGCDNVERWGSHAIWEKVLGGQRVVVSTHTILADALSHGFVTIGRLGLLIFDEAHSCDKEHSANKIMRDHYHPWRQRGDPVPAILGLTASPVIKSKASGKSLEIIEANLNAVSKTPRIHREDLRNFVRLPELVQVPYATSAGGRSSIVHADLHNTFQNIDLGRDPFVLKLRASLTPESTINETIKSKRTHCHDEIKKFCGKADHIAEQLGTWAVESFISLAVAKLTETASTSRAVFLGWETEETRYLLETLRVVVFRSTDQLSPISDISPKMQTLLAVLRRLGDKRYSGIIFVEQRATATMLCRLLSIHLRARGIVCATYVGTSSNYQRRHTIGDLVDITHQGQTLDDFQVGHCDLIIATSVLEEGIDISSCNLVISFDQPLNLKSFVQRRGRARNSKSEFVMMVAENDQRTKKTDWQAMEEEMIKSYQEDRQQIQEAMNEEDFDEDDTRRALLTPEIAVQHLNHFCDLLPRAQFCDNRPLYQYLPNDCTQLIRAEVILPNAVDASLRRVCGRCQWRTERQAKKDAAFEAYKVLYHAGLVNDNLLPTPRDALQLYPAPARLPSRVTVSGLIDPWIDVAQGWIDESNVFLTPTSITVHGPGSQNQINLFLLTPKQLSDVPPCELFWNAETTYKVSFTSAPGIDRRIVNQAREATLLVLQSAHYEKTHCESKDFVCCFAPVVEEKGLFDWMTANTGGVPASDVYSTSISTSVVARNSTRPRTPYLFHSWLESEEMEVVSLPRRRNFLKHRISPRLDRIDLPDRTVGAKLRLFPIQSTSFDRLSVDMTIFSLFVPSLMRHLEGFMIAAHLCSSILAAVQYQRLAPVVEALSASAADEAVNYQRLELIGDSTLKFLVATQLFASAQQWHEGYLSQAKDTVVSNSRLACAALDKCLDQYIIVAPFSPRKWRPRYVSQCLETTPPKDRMLSKKVLADVVEALIGAAFMDGGLERAAICAHVFLYEINATLSFEQVQRYPKVGPLDAVGQTSPQQDGELHTLLGYEFVTSTILREALTHPSLTIDLDTSSYQRLEFLGDAVLDMVVVRRLAWYPGQRLSNVQMHLIKSALVNADFLAFLCMNLSFEQTSHIVEYEEESREIHTTLSSRTLRLCDFMRALSTEVTQARQYCLTRFQRLSHEIKEAIQHSPAYPWALLLQLDAPKFMSDLVESIIGAVFVDSQGSLEACEAFAEHIGLLAYLRRIVDERVDVLHPKSALGEIAARAGKVKYQLEREEAPATGYKCTVSIGGETVVEVKDGVSKEEVTTRAATSAIRVLKEVRMTTALHKLKMSPNHSWLQPPGIVIATPSIFRLLDSQHLADSRRASILYIAPMANDKQMPPRLANTKSLEDGMVKLLDSMRLKGFIESGFYPSPKLVIGTAEGQNLESLYRSAKVDNKVSWLD